MKERLDWISDLRVIAIIGVIIIHVSSIRIEFGSITDTWWSANVCLSFVQFCVPIFVMISGVLLLSKEYELSFFLNKKLIRIIIPFLFWSLFYLLFLIFRQSIHGESFTFFQLFKFISFGLLFCPSFSFHLWYIYMLVGLLLFVPIIGKWVRNTTEKEIKYFLIIWIISIFLSLLKIGHNFIEEVNLGYLVLGFYLSNKEFNLNKKQIWKKSLALFLSGGLLTIIGTWLLTVEKGKYDSLFQGFLTPNVLLLSVGLFLMLKNNVYAKSNTITLIRNFIDKHSFGIYLIHIFVLECFNKYNVGLESWGKSGTLTIVGIIVTTFFCLFISTFIIYVINILPYGKYISGVDYKK